jgi:ribosomal protein L40E
MTKTKTDDKKLSPIPRAILAGLIAGIAAGYIAYLFVGVLGFVIGFVVGAIVGSRTVLMMHKAREQKWEQLEVGQGSPNQQIVKETIITKEVLVQCRNCGARYPQGTPRCRNCGANL